MAKKKYAAKKSNHVEKEMSLVRTSARFTVFFLKKGEKQRGNKVRGKKQNKTKQNEIEADIIRAEKKRKKSRP